MMDTSVWRPILLAPCITLVGMAMFAAKTPETRQWHMHGDEGAGLPTAHPVDKVGTARRAATALRRSLGTTAKLLHRRPIGLLVPSAALTIPLATVSLNIALRYISARYQWSLAASGMVLGGRTGLSIVVLLVILPSLSWLVRHHDTGKRDLRMAQISAAFIVVGMAVLAAAPTAAAAISGLLVFTLGSGVPALSRAVMSALVPRTHTGTLFAVLAMLEIIGYLASGLGLGALFQVGLGLGLNGGAEAPGNPALLGLPFYCAAFILLLAGIALWVARLPERENGDGLEGQGIGLAPVRSTGDGQGEIPR